MRRRFSIVDIAPTVSANSTPAAIVLSVISHVQPIHIASSFRNFTTSS
jgi:hypothetical protein